MNFTDGPAHPGRCPSCKSIQPVFVVESLNFGNLLALCETCDTEWDYTPINDQAIRAEAKRGFIWQP